jgi:hypothetical protein
MNLFKKYLNRVENSRKTDRIAVRVYSEILDCYLWVVETDQDLHTLRSQDTPEAIYTRDEIKRLQGLNKDFLREIHKFKKAFQDSKIEEISPKKRE